MKIAFLFSGQGAQCTGMMKDIAENNSEAKRVFEVADRTLERGISELCFEGSQEDLNLTHNTQPCVLAADLAACQAASAAGMKPDAVAGFSLGEYAALVAAGVIEMEDVFPLVQKRADYMQEAVPVGQGAMAAVMKVSVEEVENLCKSVNGYVIPANYNCPGQTVVSGEADAVEQLITLAKERKIRVMKLPVSAPFHCELMAPAAEHLKEALSQIQWKKPIVPVYMNIDAQPETDADSISEKLILQAKSPVRWEQTLRNMYQNGIDTFIEFGPGTTLTGFVKRTFKDGENVHLFNVNSFDTLKSTISELESITVL